VEPVLEGLLGRPLYNWDVHFSIILSNQAILVQYFRFKPANRGTQCSEVVLTRYRIPWCWFVSRYFGCMVELRVGQRTSFYRGELVCESFWESLCVFSSGITALELSPYDF